MARHDPADPAARYEIRAEINRTRLARDEAQRLADDEARDARVAELVNDLVPDGRVVACYLSREAEPGTLNLVTRLVKRRRVLVPKVSGVDDGTPRLTPNWAWFTGPKDLDEGPFGIPEPTGPGLGAESLAKADLIIASALSAGEDGSRIGTGGGWFDRALPFRRPEVPVVVLLNDEEVRNHPQLPHDQRVDWLVTPTRTIRTTRPPQPPLQ